jgi:HlyD family secretion protein
MERQKRTIVISITISLIALSIVASATLLSTKGTLEKSRIDLYSVKNQADSIFQGSIQATKEEDISLDSSLGTLASINVKISRMLKQEMFC